METSPFSNTFVVVLAVVSCFLCANAQVNFLKQSCYEEEGTYDIFRASNFPTNRDQALDHLASLASSSYFNTNTTGSGPSKSYALFQCRYDVSPQVCQQCVTAAAKQKIWCLFNVEAIIFYQECTLHYANHSIFGVREDLPRVSVYRTRNVTDVSKFSTVLTTAITSLINNVILGFPSSSRYFATKDVDYKSNAISTLAQCNPDITASDCKGCLQSAFGNFTLNYTGSGIGQMYSPTCMLTYRLSSLDDTVPDSPFNFPSPGTIYEVHALLRILVFVSFFFPFGPLQ